MSTFPTLEQLSALLPAYDFEFLIAEGATGAVYKARQLSLDRYVAIKLIPRELGADPTFRESFESKARAMARLSHPNLIKVYDYGEIDGLLFTVMEYVHGKSLFRSANRIKVDTRQAIEIVMATCCGLEHAHENNITHRDIRPTNILLNEKCEPKIGDFGLVSQSPRKANGYTAPEILNDPAQGNPRSDIFSVGILLKELITGVPADTAAFAYATLKDAYLAEICATATNANPTMRHPDVRKFCRALESWQPAKRAPRLQVPAPRQAAAPLRLSPATTSNSRTNWSLWKNCAVIAFLLIAIHLSWNVLQRKKELNRERVRVTQESSPKPAVRSLQTETKTESNTVVISTRF